MGSAICFNLDQSKILSSGKELLIICGVTVCLENWGLFVNSGSVSILCEI